jgi:hypothetical protein
MQVLSDGSGAVVLPPREMMTMRRTALLLALLVVATLAVTTSPASTRFAQALAPNPGDVAADFNNDGFADLAVGVPGENDFAGAVNVLYGRGGGLSGTGGQLFLQVGGGSEAGDGFGSALAAGDFNNDDFADLAAGAAGEAVGSAGGAGAVSVLPGSGGGLTATGGRLFTQVGGAPEIGDQFGASLAAGDFNNNGFADLAVGAPFEAVGSAGGAGAVSVLYGSGAGLTTTGGRLFTQVGGLVEARDLFGWDVAAGDFNNDGFADLTAGAPWERVGSVPLAGAVSVLPGSTAGLTTSGGRLFTQVGGLVELDDQFGAQLATGDFNNNGFADLAAAAPQETVGTAGAAGAVSVLPGSGGGLTTTGGQLFTQNSPGVPGLAESLDRFGGVGFVAG